MKLINKPQYAISSKEVKALLILRDNSNPICNALDCTECSGGCEDCPFNEVSDKLADILMETARIAQSLPRIEENK